MLISKNQEIIWLTEMPLKEEVDGDTWPRDESFLLDKDQFRWGACGILEDLMTSVQPSYGEFFTVYTEVSLWL